MTTASIALSALIFFAATAAPLPVVLEANRALIASTSPRLHTRQTDLSWIVEDVPPALAQDLSNPNLVDDTLSYYSWLIASILEDFTSELPQDVPSAIIAVNELPNVIADEFLSFVNSVLYLPKAFYYGNPLIPFSGQLPKVVAAVVALSAAVPPLRQGLIDSLTKVPGVTAAIAAAEPLTSLLPGVLAGVSPLTLPQAGDIVALPPGFPIIATPTVTLEGALSSLLTDLAVLSRPTSRPELQIPKIPALLPVPSRSAIP